MDTAVTEAFRQNIEKKYKNQSITVSNGFLRGHENTNLLESKLEALAIKHTSTEMFQKQKKDASGKPFDVNYVILLASEIQELMGRSDGKTYKEIKNAAVALSTKYMILENKEEQQFWIAKPYGDCAYNNGELYVEFNPSMEKHYFRELKNDFTKLDLSILFSYRRNGGFQIYKLLRTYVYSPKLEEIDMSLSQEELPSIDLSWNISDFKIRTGFVDIDQTLLRQEGAKKNPNWSKMVEDEKHPKYKRWDDFNRRVIIPGIKEINEIGDIYIKEVKKERKGLGGKVDTITFTVQRNKDYYLRHPDRVPRQKQKYIESEIRKTPRSLTEDQIDEFLDELRDLIDEKLKTKQLKDIAEAAGYDMDVIKKTYEASRSCDNIRNIVAWLISGIREGGYESPVKGTGKINKKNGFKNFDEREYSENEWKELEEDLLNVSMKRGLGN